ncbi:MAG: hypothetical protein LBH11_01555 [Propionibacteriaceae bacterium]|jgi:hypothetical protein|nr:hypothetical protein [Propionibacteriaceae bacterium]
MRHTRSAFSILLAGALLFGGVGCGDSDSPPSGSAGVIVEYFPLAVVRHVESLAAFTGLQLGVIGGETVDLAATSYQQVQQARLTTGGDTLEYRSDILFDAATGDTQLSSEIAKNGERDWSSSAWFANDTLYHRSEEGEFYRWQQVPGSGAPALQRYDMVLSGGGTWRAGNAWSDAARALATVWTKLPSGAFSENETTIALYTGTEVAANEYVMLLFGTDAEAQAKAVFTLLGGEPTYGAFLRELAYAVSTGVSDASLRLSLSLVDSTVVGLGLTFQSGTITLNFRSMVYVDGFATHRAMELSGVGVSLAVLAANEPNSDGGYRLTFQERLTASISAAGQFGEFTEEVSIQGDGVSSAETPLNHDVHIYYNASAPGVWKVDGVQIDGDAKLIHTVADGGWSVTLDAPELTLTYGEENPVRSAARVEVSRTPVATATVTPPQFMADSDHDVITLIDLFDARGITIRPAEYLFMPPEVRFAMVVFAR